jgi:uncharacterized membrane protein YccC
MALFAVEVTVRAASPGGDRRWFCRRRRVVAMSGPVRARMREGSRVAVAMLMALAVVLLFSWERRSADERFSRESPALAAR